MNDLTKIHIIAVIAHILTIVYAFIWPVATLVMLLPVSLIWFHLGHGVFIHRYFTHKHFNFSKLGIFLGHLFYIPTNMGLAIMWSSMHNKHHMYSGTNKDPHEWRQVGILKALVSDYGDAFSVDVRNAVKAKKEPFAKFFTKAHYIILSVLVIPLAPVVAMSFWWKQFTTIVVHLDIGDYSKREGSDTSTNIKFLHWLMWGDEKHNDHHNDTSCANLGNDYLYKIGKVWEKI